jgi:hypothetical protein
VMCSRIRPCGEFEGCAVLTLKEQLRLGGQSVCVCVCMCVYVCEHVFAHFFFRERVGCVLSSLRHLLPHSKTQPDFGLTRTYNTFGSRTPFSQKAFIY